MFDELVSKIEAKLKTNDRVIIAIDGQAASGKTTLAKKLSDLYHAPVIHMDDYFLQPHQRVEGRLKEIGGNIDYERFEDEVMKHLKDEIIDIQPFNCQTMQLEEKKSIVINRILIIEGAYAMRSFWYTHFDMNVLITIDPNTQLNRIQTRNPKLYQRFIEEWIPKENIYLSTNNLISIADIHIHIKD